MKRILQIYSILLTIFMGIFVSGCDPHDTTTTIPSLNPSDIIMGPHDTNISSRWLTNGQMLQIIIKDLDYSTTASDVVLTSVKIEKDGNPILTVPFKLNDPINIKVDDWKHGENTLKLIALFKSNNDEVEKEISSYTLTIFNELPKYDIEGYLTYAIKWMASNGEKFEKYMEIHSIDHVFKYSFNIVWLASNGEKFQCSTLKNIHPYFFINKDATNFDANITKEELHWRTPDGPADLPKEETLADTEYLYVDFTVIGIHEGIQISQDITIGFKFLREPNK